VFKKNNKQTNKYFLVCFLFFVSNFYLSGINFRDLNLSGDTLLFKANFESQSALFTSRLTDLSMQQLTAFPERLELINNGRTVLVYSRFGAVTIPASGGLPSTLKGFPSFTTGDIPLKGRGYDFTVSGDGRWLLYIEPTSPAYGNLLLIDITSGAKWKVSEKIELPSTDFPACWSPDSRLFVYSRGDRLYHYPIISDLSTIVDERFRQIGPGAINTVLWGQHGDFYYFHDNTLYRVIHPELLTRTIYGDFLSIGDVAGVFPFSFESSFDRYWISPDSGSILINKRGKSIFLFLLGENQYSNSVLPHVMIPQGAGNINVFWRAPGQLTIMSSLQKDPKVWRFEINENTIKAITTENIPISSTGVLSPDGTRVLFWGEKGLELWDYTNWQLIQTLSREEVFSCIWLNNREIITGNSKFTEVINLTLPSFPRRRLSLSGSNIDQFGFSDQGRSDGVRISTNILVRIGTEWFVSNGINPWTLINDPVLRNVSLSSENFRVYLENQLVGPFKNVPMIRNTASLGTFSLISGHSSGNAYTQGRKMQIALCFDLYDDDTGLTQVLNALRRHNKRATFFMNGNFIRRNPQAAAAITEAGHEAASLFYAPVDLSDARYRFSPDFIRQGLARNEDEFFRATGKELSLIWHPPYFRSSEMINSAAASAGYVTAARDVDPGDWLSSNDALRLNIIRNSTSEIIEQIIRQITEKSENRAVVPVRLGLLPGGRNEYLYQRIDVLIDALIRSGFEIVPVSSVVK
jgi:peptidoglycan/xylan/chitin deacetylase (PgdA/CDA1 family)